MRILITVYFALFYVVTLFGQTVSDPNCTISNFASTGVNITEIAVDETNDFIYFTRNSTSGPLYRLDLSGTVTTVTLSFAGSPATGHPYIATDIEYHNGYVYSVDFNDHLFRTDVSTGTKTILATVSGLGIENGIAIIGDDVYFTDGNSGLNTIYRYDITGGGVTAVVAGLPSTSYEGLEYNAATNTLYYGSRNHGLYSVNLGAGTLTLVAGFSGGNANFAIDPPGDYAYWLHGSTISQVDLNTGVQTTFVSSTGSGSSQDLEFLTSSSGSGNSLYFGANTIMKEVECPQFEVVTQPIPTLSQWGLIIFTLLLLSFGTVAVWNGRFRGARAEA